MGRQIIVRFLVDHPIGPGAVRAILDTLTAQGGAYEPQLVRRPPDQGVRRITGARPTRLLDEVGEGGTSTTFLRVSEGSAHPVLTFMVSETPRTSPTCVTLTVPEDTLASSKEIEQVLGICKGLYLFLESPWGTAGVADPAVGDEAADAPLQPRLDWTTFLGPQAVARLGPARLLTSMAFIVEILPDGGIMLVTHAVPSMAILPEGVALRRQIAETVGLNDHDGTWLAPRILDVSRRRRVGARPRESPPSGSH